VVTGSIPDAVFIPMDRPQLISLSSRPILPVPHAAPFDDPAWLFEPKCDGFRGLL
jgi:hypothetical protein